jgi:hypothetical protein
VPVFDEPGPYDGKIKMQIPHRECESVILIRERTRGC